MEDIQVHVTAEHLKGFDPNMIETDSNPVSTAVLEALRAEGSEYRDRLPEEVGVDVLMRDNYWRINLWAKIGEPWNGYAILIWWPADEGGEDNISEVMYGDEPEPFTFKLSSEAI